MKKQNKSKLKKNLGLLLSLSCLLFVVACFTTPSSDPGKVEEVVIDTPSEEENPPALGEPQGPWLFVSGTSFEGEMHLVFKNSVTQANEIFFKGPLDPAISYALIVDDGTSLVANPAFVGKPFDIGYEYGPVQDMSGEDVSYNVIQSIELIGGE